MYQVNVQNIGLISMIPILAGAGGILVAAFLCDYLRGRQIFSQQTVSNDYFYN